MLFINLVLFLYVSKIYFQICLFLNINSIFTFYKFIKNEYSNFIATNLTKENVLDDFNKLEMKYKEFIHRSYIEGKSEQAMMAYFDMTMAVQKEGIYVRDLIDINKNKKNKSERKSILDEINKSHSEIRLNNDIKLQNYYKNIIEKVS